MLVLKTPASAAEEVQARPGALLVALAISAAFAVIVGALGGAAAWMFAKPKTQS
jgi:hypothetical protein